MEILFNKIHSTYFKFYKVVQSYNEGNLPHSVVARIKLPGMWEHTGMLHNRLWQHDKLPIQYQVHKPNHQCPTLKYPLQSPRFLQSTPLPTSPKANKSSTPLH